ncbi:MAG: rane protein [Verrucomicrobiales bacterium]|nr:rane protein [Verrucomicrobiales bacterium]
MPEAHAVLAITMAATSLIGLARRLPAQNVVTAAAIITSISLCILAFGRQTGIPFGAFDFARAVEFRVLGVPPVLPIYWTALAICARGFARLPLRPWRKTNHYGYWMIALSLIIVLFIVTSAEPVLGERAHYWIWKTKPRSWTWHGMPWSNWLGCAVSFFAIYLFATPWLINKQPVKQPVDWHPMLMVILLEIYFAAANLQAGNGGAAAMGSCGMIILVFFAIRGGRW